MPQSTPSGKWVLWEKSSGERVERWPVDAREQLASDLYTDVAPEGYVEPEPLKTPESAPAQAVQEHSPGVPLVLTSSADASPAAPVQLPTQRASGRANRPPGAK